MKASLNCLLAAGSTSHVPKFRLGGCCLWCGVWIACWAWSQRGCGALDGSTKASVESLESLSAAGTSEKRSMARARSANSLPYRAPSESTIPAGAGHNLALQRGASSAKSGPPPERMAAKFHSVQALPDLLRWVWYTVVWFPFSCFDEFAPLSVPSQLQCDVSDVCTLGPMAKSANISAKRMYRELDTRFL